MFINAKLSSIRFISSYILALGLLVLSIPIYADKMNVAILTHISGTVEISNSADREADFGVDIYEGDIISTAKEGTFTLTFYNGCRQEQVKKNSSIKVGMSSSSIIKGGFSNINTFDCEVPAPQLGMDDSHKKAGITFRGADIDKEVKKIAYENKIVSSCVTNNSKKTIKQLRKNASEQAFQQVLSQFIKPINSANLDLLNNPLVQKELLSRYVNESKIIKYSNNNNKVCAKVSISANSKILDKGLKECKKSNKLLAWEVNQNQSSDLHFKLWTNRKESPFFRDDEEIFIYFVSNKDVYLKLDYFMADGTVAHLVPNILPNYNKLKAGKLYILGGKSSEIDLVATPPYGTEEIRAIVNKEPFSSEIQKSEAVEESRPYEKIIAKYISKHKSKNILANTSFELISTP